MTLHTTRKAARAAGARFYCTGMPCQSGHNVARYTSNSACVACNVLWSGRVWPRPPKRSPAELPRTAAEARRQRSHLFFNGEACGRGHVAPRRTHSHSCVECERVNSARHKAKRRELADKGQVWPPSPRRSLADVDCSGLPRTRAEALDQGSRLYFDGRACGRGHVAPRKVSSRGCAWRALRRA